VKNKPIIAMGAPVSIQAAEGDEDKGPRTFSSTFYTGGPLDINGYDLPVVVDLSGLKNGRVLVANLDHDSTKRVGNFEVVNDGSQLVANGKATAATAARDEVVNSAANGYQWQASLEVQPHKIEQIAKGKTVTVNGQQIVGPAYVTRSGTLKGFAFVSHGADDNTTATIAASAASSTKEFVMDPKFKAWIEAMGFDADTLTESQIAGLQANYDGKNGKPAQPEPIEGAFAKKKAEKARVDAIMSHAIEACDRRPQNIDEIQDLANTAIEGKWTIERFRLELLEATIPTAHTPFSRTTTDARLNSRVIEAAICQAGRLGDYEKRFDDQTLQTAHDKFRNGIGLKQLYLLAAEANGYRGNTSFDVTLDVQRAAFGMTGARQINATGFSTIDIATILSNVANKFLMDGWNAVDQTPLRIAAIQPVRDFKTITTVSLTDNVIYEQVGATGQIKHGTLDELTYTNKADTYARMLAITRQDIINDDLGALTAVPRKLGAGAMKKLNDIFWRAFLLGVSTNFFSTSPNNNLNDGVANMTIGGLAATEAKFMMQTNPDGTPLGLMPSIILVPVALKATATALMDTQSKLITGASATLSDVNVFAGRFRVESSPYISNTSYTGNTTAGWWMLANPSELPVIAIAALNGRVEPTVETADADFNVLGVQMRGYSDVGVNLQEYRGGVYADGGDT
jgi:hypothetical protein